MLVAALVIGVIAGLLLTLRASRNIGTPSPEALARAKQRQRERAAEEADQGDD